MLDLFDAIIGLFAGSPNSGGGTVLQFGPNESAVQRFNGVYITELSGVFKKKTKRLICFL